MSEQLPSDSLSTKADQLSKVREWITAAKGKTYKKRDKRRFARLGFDGMLVTMELSEAEDWISDAPEGTYTLAEAWLTVKQFEDLPEFAGF